MSTLTWRNVDAPDFRTSLEALRLAGTSLDRGFTGLAEGLGKFREYNQSEADAAAIARSLEFTAPDQLQAALRSGEITGGPATAMSMRGLEMLGNRPNALLRDATATEALSHATALNPLIRQHQVAQTGLTTAQTGLTGAQTVTEGYRPALIGAQTDQARAGADYTRAQTGTEIDYNRPRLAAETRGIDERTRQTGEAITTSELARARGTHELGLTIAQEEDNRIGAAAAIDAVSTGGTPEQIRASIEANPDLTPPQKIAAYERALQLSGNSMFGITPTPGTGASAASAAAPAIRDAVTGATPIPGAAGASGTPGGARTPEPTTGIFAGRGASGTPGASAAPAPIALFSGGARLPPVVPSTTSGPPRATPQERGQEIVDRQRAADARNRSAANGTAVVAPPGLASSPMPGSAELAARIPIAETRDYVTRIGARAGDVRGRNNQETAERLTPHVMRQESGGRDDATSRAGAYGRMQLMPGTARQLERQLGMPPGETDRNPAANQRAGTEYLRQMLDRYNGNVPLALAAYNAGPGRADQWAGRNLNLSLPGSPVQVPGGSSGPGGPGEPSPQGPGSAPALIAGAQAVPLPQDLFTPTPLTTDRPIPPEPRVNIAAGITNAPASDTGAPLAVPGSLPAGTPASPTAPRRSGVGIIGGAQAGTPTPAGTSIAESLAIAQDPLTGVSIGAPGSVTTPPPDAPGVNPNRDAGPEVNQATIARMVEEQLAQAAGIPAPISSGTPGTSRTPGTSEPAPASAAPARTGGARVGETATGASGAPGALAQAAQAAQAAAPGAPAGTAAARTGAPAPSVPGSAAELQSRRVAISTTAGNTVSRLRDRNAQDLSDGITERYEALMNDRSSPTEVINQLRREGGPYAHLPASRLQNDLDSLRSQAERAGGRISYALAGALMEANVSGANSVQRMLTNWFSNAGAAGGVSGVISSVLASGASERDARTPNETRLRERVDQIVSHGGTGMREVLDTTRGRAAAADYIERLSAQHAATAAQIQALRQRPGSERHAAGLNLQLVQIESEIERLTKAANGPGNQTLGRPGAPAPVDPTARNAVVPLGEDWVTMMRRRAEEQRAAGR